MSEKFITEPTYRSLEEAYEWFNSLLFNGDLPRVLITLQRKNRSHGYFSPGKFTNRDDENVASDELALNPDGFIGRTDKEVLSTLAHEQVHVWQQYMGEAPRKSYHDKQWSKKMKSIGLYPSDTGFEGGRETGAKMSHYIIPEGEFEKAYEALAKRGFRLSWQSMPNPPAETKSKNKVAYVCECGLKVWAKPNARLYCANCTDLDGKPVEMLAEGGVREEEQQDKEAA